jgi:uncharacterized OsmC-like protein
MMSNTHDLAAALQRVQAVVTRRPEAGLHEDAAATARWQGGLQVEAWHAEGERVHTDMPGELGGTATHPTPGWLLRAALASCLTTRVAMEAASEGLDLAELEVRAESRSDLRGLFGLAEADGRPVDAGPLDVALHVRIAAPGVPAERLRALVERSHERSPVSNALRGARPVALHVEAGGAGSVTGP